MLREVENVKQDSGDLKKRWFASLSMDLFVWEDVEGNIVGYQLTYDKPRNEKAIVWNEAEGFLHFGVDDGSRPGRHPKSPMLVPDGAPEPEIASRLLNNQEQVPQNIVRFIAENIRANIRNQ